MAENNWNEEYHARRCAVRNIPTALFFVMFCGLEVYLSWKILGRPFQAYNFFAVLRNVVVIAACAQSLMMFTCFRERLVVGTVLVRFAIGLVFGFVPLFVNPIAGLLRFGNLALWVFALLVSLSMLFSAIQRPKQVSSYR